MKKKANRYKRSKNQTCTIYQQIGIGSVSGGTPWTNDPGMDEVKAFHLEAPDNDIAAMIGDGEKIVFTKFNYDFAGQLSHGANFNYGSKLMVIEVITQNGVTWSPGTFTIPVGGTLTDIVNYIVDKPFAYRILKTIDFSGKNAVLQSSTTGYYPDEHYSFSVNYTKQANKIASVITENPASAAECQIRIMGLFYDNGGTCSNFYCGHRYVANYYKEPRNLRLMSQALGGH